MTLADDLVAVSATTNQEVRVEQADGTIAATFDELGAVNSARLSHGVLDDLHDTCRETPALAVD